jgi:capsular exopolysaccharide synthesis family protein
MEKEVFQLPKSQRELIEIKRDFELNNKVYTFLLEKRAEANIQMASTSSDKKIVDSAMLLNDNYTYPNKKLIYVLFIVVIFGGLVLFLILKAILFAKVDSLELVKQYIPNVSYLGDLPHCKAEVLNEGDMINPNSLVFEKLRMITSNMKLTLGKGNGPVVIGVTSYIQAEGKSFFSKNIGHSLTLSNHKVLFIDADMRKVKNTDKSSLGLSSYLSGSADLEECIVSSKYSGFDQISQGPLPPNPINLLESESMVKLIQEVKTKYDYIFLDLPPVGIIADWISVKDELDHTVYLIRENYSPMESIMKLVDMENNKISFVYNDNELLVKAYYNSYYKQ